ncbi:MAG: FAD-binding oxidoreductase [Acidobacteria bacterium]|jgi:sarcosine oxidase subunit beta|nr:FAD-binding oxidoreductase [Acidobacteriota bacterium]
MKNARIIIIGGGAIGASVAYHLTERGAKSILILEREAAQGFGSTGKATGGIRAQFETDINIKMSLYSIEFFENCTFESGYEPRGYLFFATDGAHFDYLKRNIEKQKSHGVKDVEIVDAKTIAQIVKGINCADIRGGTFGARDGFINPLGVLEGFTKRATENGARIQTETEVFSIEVSSGKVKSVKTNKGKIECETIVLCAGAWARKVAETVGIDLPVEPLKRQIVWAKSETDLQENLPMVIDLSSGFHFRPAKNSRREVLFAYPDADEKPSFDTNFDDGFIAKVYERAKYRAPFLYETEVVREKCRAGLYENTPDNHAIIGGCAVEGLYFCNGFSGHGVMHSPAAGRAVAEIILDGEAKFLDVSCLSLERFATGELLHETAFI